MCKVGERGNGRFPKLMNEYIALGTIERPTLLHVTLSMGRHEAPDFKEGDGYRISV